LCRYAAASSSAETHDRFRDVMVPFAESADADVTAAQSLAGEVGLALFITLFCSQSTR
jgi:hypothetical protein